MKIYAEVPSRRLRQILSDGAAVFWVALWVRIGLWIGELVNRLAGPARTIERAGSELARPLVTASREVGELPLVGRALSLPLDAAAGAGHSLQGAGSAQQEVVHTLAVWLGVLIAAIPISLVIARYVPRRVRWIREASAVQRLRLRAADLQLFALRAIASRPLYELGKATADPAAAFAAGEYEALAAIELQALGLRGAGERTAR
ncbi:MAG: hypothetical protein M3198_17850 [Actinomycetota bacterium]|nr:hypothetical protein [Actinomycetota bacterium]